VFAWYHVGIIWLIQVVVWPLFAYVGGNAFRAYREAWWRGIRYVIFYGLALLAALVLHVARG